MTIFRNKSDSTMPKVCYGSGPGLPLSPAVRAGDFVYIAGRVPSVGGKTVEGTIQQQTDAALLSLDETLKLAGCDKDDVVRVFVILTDLSEFSGFNEAYAKYFDSNPPVRTTIEAKLAGTFRVEIEAVAYKPL